MFSPTQGRPGRRKIALACEPCRLRKSRCDGGKPICSLCQRRRLRLSQCVYKSGNARSLDSDAYVDSLHARIRELEQACEAGRAEAELSNRTSHLPSDGGVDDSAGPLIMTSHETPSPPMSLSSDFSQSALDHDAIDTLAPHEQPQLEQPASEDPLLNLPITVPASPSTVSRIGSTTDQVADATDGQRIRPNVARNRSERTGQSVSRDFSGLINAKSPTLMVQDVPDRTATQSQVSAMGAISVEEEEPQKEESKEFFGSSSAASFLREVRKSIGFDGYRATLHSNETSSNRQSAPLGLDFTANSWHQTTQSQVHYFSLPPRELADHLLERYWERVHYLYPFFSRFYFEKAYERLWISRGAESNAPPSRNIGLAGSPDSYANSIVFHCALNTILALSCHFSDLQPSDKEPVAHIFFLRAKSMIGLDLLDVNEIGVVQTLLLVALYLQSTPYPNRCWNAVGLACRIAQGLGLHMSTRQCSLNPVALDIQRRTWHGCVILDTMVSMTFGRPTTHSHLSAVPLPLGSDEDTMPDQQGGNSTQHDDIPTPMRFYIESIKLIRILNSILSEVYHLSTDNPDLSSPSQQQFRKFSRPDLVMDIDLELVKFRSSLPPYLCWIRNNRENSNSDEDMSIYELQTNVLHARFLYLKIMLFRPIFIQTCSRRDSGDKTFMPISNDASSTLTSSFFTQCALSCLNAAMELLALTDKVYLTNVSGAWWYNGLYASTAGIVLIMALSCPRMLELSDKARLKASWACCLDILRHLSSFSVTSQKQLGLLCKTYEQISRNTTRIPTRSGCASPSGQETHLGAESTLPGDEETDNLNPWIGGTSSGEFAPSYMTEGFGLFDATNFLDFSDLGDQL